MTIERVGIVGSGIMGSGIAEVCAKGGFEVVLRSRRRDTADATLATLERSLTRQVARDKLDETDRDRALARVTATTSLGDLAGCDLVIESVVEDLALKQELFRELDRICTDDAVLATNTSTLPVIEMAMETHRPELVCGLHFFNPAPAMSLVEIVRTLVTAEDVIARVRDLVGDCGKSPVVVGDRAGFIVNALLFPYLNNAIRLAENGIASMEDVDAAMMGGCNLPMGPFALLDLVGLDTSLAILDALHEQSRDPNLAPSPVLRRMVTAGLLGRKSGRGFYDYGRQDNGRRAGQRAAGRTTGGGRRAAGFRLAGAPGPRAH